MRTGEVQVCIECKHPNRVRRWRGQTGGQALHDRLCHSPALQALQDASLDLEIRLRPVACLGNCARRCRVNLSGAGRWSWLLGSLHPEGEEAELLAVLEAWLQSDKGLIPKTRRSPWLVKKALGRVPPPLPRSKK
ncbi:DUF1636 family protein [Rhodovibrionaceae bacterium A322]